MKMLLLTLSLLLGDPGDAEAPAAAEEIVYATYDLTPALPSFEYGERYESLIPALLSIERWSSDWDDSSEFEPPYDDLAELLRDLHANEFDYEGRELHLDEHGRLFIAAPPAVHQSVKRVLAFLESTFARSVEVRVDVVEAPPNVSVRPGVISLQEADRFLGEATSASAERGLELAAGTGRTSLRIFPGRTAGLDRSELISLVPDYNVEIASKSVILDPRVDTYAIGERLFLRGAAAPGGLSLSLLWKDSDRVGEVRWRELKQGGFIVHENGISDSGGSTRLQTLDAISRSLALTTFLPVGQALVIDCALDVRTGRSRRYAVLRIQGPLPEPLVTLQLGGERTLELLDSSFVAGPRVGVDSVLLQRGRLLRSMRPVLELDGEMGWGEPGIMGYLRAEDADWIEERLYDDEYEREVRRFGPWLARYPSDPDSDEQPPPMTRQHPLLELVRTPDLVHVSLRLTSRRGRGPAQDLAHWDLPIAAGSECAAVVGGETLLVRDVSVEVAEAAAASDPQVGTTFDGLALWLRPSRGAEGALTLDLVARGHVLAGPLEVAEVGASSSTSKLEQPRYESLSLDEHLRFPAGGSPESRRVVLGAVDGGPGLTLVVEVR